MKQSQLHLENDTEIFWMWEFCFVGLLAPRPRQHRMLHPKLRLTAQEKSNEKKIFCSAFSQKNMRKFYARRAEFGIKRPAFTRGYGGGASPHIQPHPFQSWADFMPEGHNLGVRFCGFAGLVLEGGVGFQEGFGKGLAHD